MPFIPYLFFPGTCEQALKFYAQVFGGEIEDLMHYSEMPPGEAEIPGFMADWVMNASFRVGDAVLMASDNPPESCRPAQGSSLYLGFDGFESARDVFTRLAEGGEVTMAFEPTFWSPGFGTCRDKFGTSWMIGVDEEPPGAPA